MPTVVPTPVPTQEPIETGKIYGYVKDAKGDPITSGGVPVAAEIAKVLGLSLDVIIVRKIQLPDNPEAGFGAVGTDGEVSLNTNLISQLHSQRKRSKDKYR